MWRLGASGFRVAPIVTVLRSVGDEKEKKMFNWSGSVSCLGPRTLA